MKFVHLSCLNSWRYASPNAKSVYQCDQCGYRYHFNRTQFAAIVGSLYTRVLSHKSPFLMIDFLHHHNVCFCSIHFRLHLQIRFIFNWCVSSVYKYLRPPRSSLRHRSRQRNVRIRPGFLGLPSSKDLTRCVLQWNWGCCTLGFRSYWSCSLGIRLGDGQSWGFRDPSPFWQLAKAWRGRKQTQRDDGRSHVGNCDSNRYRKVLTFCDKLIVEC